MMSNKTSETRLQQQGTGPVSPLIERLAATQCKAATAPVWSITGAVVALDGELLPYYGDTRLEGTETSRDDISVLRFE